MTLNIYVVPVVISAAPGALNGTRVPKYADTVYNGLQYAMLEYGQEPWCLIGIVDIPAATDTTLRANGDVTAIPTNLDQQIGPGGTLNQVRNALESVKIPGNWIASSNTWREVVRFVAEVCQFSQKIPAVTQLFGGGATLATQYGNLAQSEQDQITSAATFFGFSTAILTSTATLRQILMDMASQWSATLPVPQLAGVPL